MGATAITQNKEGFRVRNNDDLDVSVIIPTYNERGNLLELISRIDKAFKNAGIKYEVIIVDDNSPDGTADLAMELSKSYPIKVIKRPGKLGLSSAVLDGLKVAKADIVAVMDADLQHPPEVLPKLYTKISDGCDIAIASRYVEGGVIKEWGIIRRLMSQVATLLAHIILPCTRGIKDVMSGYFMFKKEIIKDADLNPRGFKILLEILAKGKHNDVCEIPYEFGVRKYGKSKLGSKEIFDYVIHLIKLSPPYIKFAIVGASGTVVNLSIVALLKYVLGVIHEIAAAVGIEVSIINNFILNDIWTFRKRRRGSRWVRLLKFHASSLAGVITQYAVSVATYHLLIHESVSSQFIGILAGFIINYLISKSYVWR